MKIVLACDESGAKGYSDQTETCPGEIGVFAGILVTEPMLAEIGPAFQEIHDARIGTDGKLHVADLSADDQRELREQIFKAIERFGLPCLWHAVHVEGFHHYHASVQAIIDGGLAAVKASHRGAEPRIKGRSPRQFVESLHVEFFMGLYARATAYIEERHPRDDDGLANVDIEIRMDRVDQPIADKFKAKAVALLDDTPSVSNPTAFDTVERKKVQCEISFASLIPPTMALDIRVRNLTLRTTGDGDGLVLAADVLANSLNRLFLSRSDDRLYADLNTSEAVAGHRLARNLDTFRNWDSADLIGDRLYRHPKAPRSALED